MALIAPITTRRGSTYSDLDFGMRRDLSDHLKVVVDLEAVTQSIDTIFLTPVNSRKFLPEFGSVMDSILFEPISVSTAITITNEIRNVINRWDPRLVLSEVTVIPDYDHNSYDVLIRGYVDGLEEFSYSKAVSAG